VPILRVHEIIEFERPRPVPRAPTAIRGVVNLRGQILPVVDLARKLGLDPLPPTRKACIVVVDVAWREELMRLGLAVDEVCDVVELREADIEPPPAFATLVRLDFLQGVGKAPGHVLLLLDLDRTLAQHELLAAAEAVSTPPDAAASDASGAQ